MNLYLSSYHFGNQAKDFAQFFKNKNIALISNALDFSNDQDRRIESTKREVDDLFSLGLNPTDLDLREFFGKQDDLQKILQNYGGVWVRGGNTFVLRRAFAYSGLDMILTKLKNTDFVYSGYSAGACVVTPTLKGIDLVDDPTTTPHGYKQEIIWSGLGLVKYSIAPHYKSNHPESELINKAVDYFIENKMPFKTLRDGEDIIEII